MPYLRGASRPRGLSELTDTISRSEAMLARDRAKASLDRLVLAQRVRLDHRAKPTYFPERGRHPASVPERRHGGGARSRVP
ncbi:MAG: hypothetical protein M0008_02055 [Actinomycetota bacterium]|nr:hypothetical protein [Actinomycetota bacterium]